MGLNDSSYDLWLTKDAPDDDDLEGLAVPDDEPDDYEWDDDEDWYDDEA